MYVLYIRKGDSSGVWFSLRTLVEAITELASMGVEVERWDIAPGHRGENQKGEQAC